MEAPDLTGLLHALRRFGAEPTDVEVKSGAGGFPTSVRETLVAFANTNGGLILIGIDEEADFAVVDLPDIGNYRDRLIDMSRTAVTPPLQVETDFVMLEGKRVLAAGVPAITADLRPAYVTAKGVTNGAYIRTGDGDRRMSEAEIALTYASRTQRPTIGNPFPMQASTISTGVRCYGRSNASDSGPPSFAKPTTAPPYIGSAS